MPKSVSTRLTVMTEKARFGLNGLRAYLLGLGRQKTHLFALIAVIVSVGVFAGLQNTSNAATTAPQDQARLVDYSLPYDFYAGFEAPSSLRSHTLKLKYGDSLGPLLQKNGLAPNEAYELTKSFSKVYDPRALKVGQKFHLIFENDQIRHLSYKPSVEKTVFVDRQADNSFKARSVEAEFRTEYMRVKTQIKNSLYLDANELGVPDRAIQQFANIYEYSVDFQRDIQPGDPFELLFEVSKDHHGQIVKSGDLLYTSFSPRGKTLSYYLYETTQGRENFYDEKGKTAKRKLRATPINGARISSRFGKRRHPVLGYVKTHKGVDFAAPRGTPILAAGSGVVERASWFGSFGKYIRIRHTDGYKTAYAHLNGYARGIRKGARVRQDQVIGYVGTTGRSTGPHLHYEVHYKGKAINPRRLAQLSGKPLAHKEMEPFSKRRADIDQWRAQTPLIQPEIPDSEVLANHGELSDISAQLR